jgi:hypothetical protein
MGLPIALADVMVTTPVYCPGASEPEFTETETVPGVVPVVPEDPAVAVSQDAPLLVLTVNGTPEGVDVTGIGCAGGAAPPANWLNCNCVVGLEMVAC